MTEQYDPIDNEYALEVIEGKLKRVEELEMDLETIKSAYNQDKETLDHIGKLVDALHRARTILTLRKVHLEIQQLINDENLI